MPNTMYNHIVEGAGWYLPPHTHTDLCSANFPLPHKYQHSKDFLCMNLLHINLCGSYIFNELLRQMNMIEKCVSLSFFFCLDANRSS